MRGWLAFGAIVLALVALASCAGRTGTASPAPTATHGPNYLSPGEIAATLDAIDASHAQAASATTAAGQQAEATASARTAVALEVGRQAEATASARTAATVQPYRDYFAFRKKALEDMNASSTRLTNLLNRPSSSGRDLLRNPLTDPAYKDETSAVIHDMREAGFGLQYTGQVPTEFVRSNALLGLLGRQVIAHAGTVETIATTRNGALWQRMLSDLEQLKQTGDSEDTEFEIALRRVGAQALP